jgi:hypothetical protein
VSNVLGCICKDEVGSITEVEGNINSVKCVDILDNNRLPVVLKFENYQWIFQDDSAPRYTCPYRQNCRMVTMLSIVLFGHPNLQTLI